MYIIRNKNLIVRLKRTTLKNEATFLETSPIIEVLECIRTSILSRKVGILHFFYLHVLLPIYTSTLVKSAWSFMYHRLHFLDKWINYNTLFHHFFLRQDSSIWRQFEKLASLQISELMKCMCYIDTIDVIHSLQELPWT